MQQNLSLPGRLKKTFIGNRAFYAMALAIVMPIIIQNAITNFVSLLDNIMVGQIGTEQMSGVSIGNQLLFVFNLCCFGGLSGAGIFAAQFHGSGNHKGVQNCFRYKFYLCLGLFAIALILFLTRGEQLISLYLNDTSAPEQVEATLKYGLDYLHIMLWGLLPFAITQAYAGTLRETGETSLPMRAGIVAVFVNLVFNYLMIYGHLGFPAMGVKGAAWATVISRYVELVLVIGISHAHPDKYPFVSGLYKTMRIPRPLVRDITLKGMPLLVNEALWSMGVAALSQCYSMRGLDVVAAMNISSTVSNLFNVVFLSMGNATAIIVGQSLGANNPELAKDQAWKLTAFSLFGNLFTSILMAATAPFVPLIYQTTHAVHSLATSLLLVYAACSPLFSFANSSYFILRSGGKTLVTFVFDCVFSWFVSLPLAWCLIYFTNWNIVAVYLCVQLADFIKCVFGAILVKKGIWINNMVSE